MKKKKTNSMVGDAGASTPHQASQCMEKRKEQLDSANTYVFEILWEVLRHHLNEVIHNRAHLCIVTDLEQISSRP